MEYNSKKSHYTIMGTAQENYDIESEFYQVAEEKEKELKNGEIPPNYIVRNYGGYTLIYIFGSDSLEFRGYRYVL